MIPVMMLLLAASGDADLGEITLPPGQPDDSGQGTSQTGDRRGVVIQLIFAEDELPSADRLYVLDGEQSVGFMYEVTSRWPNEWVRTMVLLADLLEEPRERTIRIECRRRRNREARESREPIVAGDTQTAAARVPPRLPENSPFGPIVRAADGGINEGLVRTAYNSRTWIENRQGTDPENNWRRWRRDPIHALYQAYAASGDVSILDSARCVALEYRTDEFIPDGTIRARVRSAGAGLSDSPDIVAVECHIVQGLLDDYLFSGDRESLAAAERIGETLADVSQVMLGDNYWDWGGTRGYVLIQLTALYEVTRQSQWFAAANQLAEGLMGSQDAAGAWAYPYERNGLTGGCTHATGGDPDGALLAIEGLVRYAAVRDDRRARDAAVRGAVWLLSARTPNGNTLMHAAACPQCGPRTTSRSDNLSAATALYFAATHTRDPRVREAAQALLDSGRSATSGNDGESFANSFRWAFQAEGYRDAAGR